MKMAKIRSRGLALLIVLLCAGFQNCGAPGGRNFLNPGSAYDLSGYDMKDLLYTFNTHLGMGLSNFVGNNNLIKI
jgi:hypothetical protein